MTWIISTFVIGVALAVTVGPAFRKERPAGVLLALLSCVCILFGALGLVSHYDGDVGSISRLNAESIYRIDGRAETSKGAIVILSNGIQKVRAVWAEESNLPENTQYVRVLVSDKWKLVPADAVLPPKTEAEASATQPHK